MLLFALMLACVSDEGPLPGAEPPPPPPPELPPPPPPEKPRNQAPVIEKLALQPSAIDTNTDIRADVKAADPDGGIARLTYAWTVNDKVLYEVTTKALPSRYFDKDDEITLRVTADDGEDREQAEIKVTVGNASPSFVSDPRSLKQIDGFQLEVTDPDDDEIAFRIEDAPRGMSIDKNSGTLRYQGSADEPGGDYRVKIFAEDPDGGHALWEFSLTVNPGSGARP